MPMPTAARRFRPRGFDHRKFGEPGAEIVRPASYLGIEHSDNLTLIRLTVSDTRTVDQKKALFARIVHHLSKNPGLRPDDVFINLVEVKKENWSFGRGIAQYA
jgi:4-oxalocrotonate tautomerase